MAQFASLTVVLCEKIKEAVFVVTVARNRSNEVGPLSGTKNSLALPTRVS